MLEIRRLAIPDVIRVTPRRIGDLRGWFSETYNEQRFAAAGIGIRFVQDNQSCSARAGTVRGLHFQAPPFAQAKLVRVLRGSVFDVAVDLRRSSATYGRWIAETLTASGGEQLLIPAGFAHGFCTLEADTEVLYKVDSHYAPTHDLGLCWNDPALGIAWPVGPDAALLSDKDRRLPPLAALPAYFP